MNVSDIELFKKSKIIKIGSVKKKLRPREVGGFWKKSGNPGIFVPEIWDFGSETVRTLEISRNLEKHRDKVVSQFLRYRHNFWYTET